MQEAASRNLGRHSLLDSRISRLLPEALPPRVNSPALFLLGILPFAYIFTALENEWAAFLAKPISDEHTAQLQSALSNLRLNGLLRAERFDSDVRQIQARLEKGIEGDETDENGCKHLSSQDSATVLALRRCDVYFQTPRNYSQMSTSMGDPSHIHVSKITKRITDAARSKPHLLVAYIYVWYMAVLSGGQYLLKSIQTVESEFWGHERIGDNFGFSFLCADFRLKDGLKGRLTALDLLLAPEQRAEVVQETELIYEIVIDLVHGLERGIGSEVVGEREGARLRATALQGKQLSQGVVPFFYGSRSCVRTKLLKRTAAIVISAVILVQVAKVFWAKRLE